MTTNLQTRHLSHLATYNQLINTDFVPLKNEVVLESDYRRFKVGDGVKTYAELEYYFNGVDIDEKISYLYAQGGVADIFESTDFSIWENDLPIAGLGYNYLLNPLLVKWENIDNGIRLYSNGISNSFFGIEFTKKFSKDTPYTITLKIREMSEGLSPEIFLYSDGGVTGSQGVCPQYEGIYYFTNTFNSDEESQMLIVQIDRRLFPSDNAYIDIEYIRIDESNDIYGFYKPDNHNLILDSRFKLWLEDESKDYTYGEEYLTTTWKGIISENKSGKDKISKLDTVGGFRMETTTASSSVSTGIKYPTGFIPNEIIGHTVSVTYKIRKLTDSTVLNESAFISSTNKERIGTSFGEYTNTFVVTKYSDLSFSYNRTAVGVGIEVEWVKLEDCVISTPYIEESYADALISTQPYIQYITNSKLSMKNEEDLLFIHNFLSPMINQPTFKQNDLRLIVDGVVNNIEISPSFFSNDITSIKLSTEIVEGENFNLMITGDETPAIIDARP